MNNIIKIKLFANGTEYSNIILKELNKKLKENGYIISDNDFQLAIAIGGDGTFLKMVKECNFSDEIFYIGVNTGTLCFAGEIYPSDIDMFVYRLKNNNYKIENIGVQQTDLYFNKSKKSFYSLNEIVIRDIDLNTIKMDIKIDNNLLEKYTGDGVLISTSFGSTAYNLSFGGSIVYNDLHTLQITPIAPLNNKKYCTLNNSIIIPENRLIEINTNNKIILSIDGQNYKFNKIVKLNTYINKKIKLIRMIEYDYTKKINEKFLK